ncbi:hypothetical protein [Levilactobacillus cerevisiae]|uniref:hypothetical protein n=1 Tax=Levilactobacillus cerevisiae TaxID=1704076 RepID=UPI000F767DDA|nr:hypothetical protein [Levilactobacillus cerevisiae]
MKSKDLGFPGVVNVKVKMDFVGFQSESALFPSKYHNSLAHRNLVKDHAIESGNSMAKGFIGL